MKKKLEDLSKRAQKLHARLMAGHWYDYSSHRIPQAMQELVEAGLVTTGGRVAEIRRCYIPTSRKFKDPLAWKQTPSPERVR